MNNVTVILTPTTAEKYKLFLEHYDTFCFLLDRKVFDQKAAGITINFDATGRIGSITRNDVLYLSTKKFDNMNQKVD